MLLINKYTYFFTAAVKFFDFKEVSPHNQISVAERLRTQIINTWHNLQGSNDFI